MQSSAAAHLNLMGYNPNASSTAGTVWAVGSGSYAQLTAATALEAISSSASDAAAGVGARTIQIRGVEISTGVYLPFQETITLNGTTPVPLVNTSAVAINSVEVLTAGSSITNVGNIDIRKVSGATVKSRISLDPEAQGKARDFVYTTSSLVYGLLRNIQVFVKANTGDLWVYLNQFNSSGVKIVRTMGSFGLDNTGFASGPITIDFGDGLYIPPSTLIELVVDVSAGTPMVSATGELFLHAT